MTYPIVSISPLGGSLDDAPGIVTQLATTPVILDAGATYNWKTVHALPTKATLFVNGATILQQLTTNTGYSNASLYCAPAYATPVGSPIPLAADVLIGATTFVLNSLPAEWIASSPGSPVYCLVANPVGFCGRVFKILTVNATTKTVTVERPIDVPFTAAHSRAWVVVPPQVEIHGGGGVIRGSGDRFIELSGGWRCLVEDLTLLSEPTSVSASGITGFLGSFDVGSHECTVRRVTLDGANSGAYNGWAFESATNCVCSDVEIRRIKGTYSVAGLYIYENHGTSFHDVRISDCTFGVLIDSYDSTYATQYNPSTNLLFSGCEASGCTRYGFYVNAGASRVRFIGCTANYNQQHGFAVLTDTYPGQPTNNVSLVGCDANYNVFHGFVVGSATIQTQLKNVSAMGNAGCALYATSDFALEGFAFSDCLGSTDSGNSAVIQVAGGSALIENGLITRNETNTASYCRAVLQSSNGPVSVRGVTARLVMSGWVATAVLDHSAGIMLVENVVLDAGSSHVSYGYVSEAAGVTLIRGNGVRLDSAAVQYELAAGSFQNWGTVVAAGATPVDVLYPQLKAADAVVLTRRVDGGTPGITPRVSITPGSKFTITGSAGDSSTYGFVIL